jgi:hypothetical protein
MSRRPPGPEQGRRKASSEALSARPLRSDLTITVRHRGGPESWWEVRARGRVWRRPGYIALDDLLRDVYAGVGGKKPPAKR